VFSYGEILAIMLATSPNYRVARGVEPARSLFFSLYEQPGPKPGLVYGISNMDVLERLFMEFSVDFANPARIAANIPSRFLYTSIKGPVYGRSDLRLHRESRYLTAEQLGGCADLTIVGDTVVFMSFDSPEVVAQAITSPAVAAQMQAFFSFLWDHATP
jgi:hypothetical protein